MTVGIGAFGPNAGAAVLAAWEEAERGATDDIGGFAVFVTIPAGAGPIAVECQRGGLATIRAEWAVTGLLEVMARAPVAGVITSGPDRVVPLAQFLPAGRRGLVTGHRLPHRRGADGVALNVAALRLLEAGVPPEEAVRRIVEADPEIDAGLIAVTRDAIALADTAHVLQRRDRGQALVHAPGAGLAVLHNSIEPRAGYADRIARAGLAAFSRSPSPPDPRS